jgi:hypothetical protein
MNDDKTPAVYQRWNAGHDRNGNPRRVYVVWDADGRFFDAIDEGYAGRPEPLRDLLDLGTVPTTVNEYRRMLGRSPSGGRFFGPVPA